MVGGTARSDPERRPLERSSWGGGFAHVFKQAKNRYAMHPGPRAGLRVAYVLSLGTFVLALIAIECVEVWNSAFGWDFRAFYEGGQRYLHLQSPYVSGSLAELTSRQNFVYPLPTAALFAPISLVPYHLAAVLFVLSSAALLVLGLRLVGVRDWRCYAAVFLGAPALDGTDLGTISPILAFAIAVLWRYRDRRWVIASTLAFVVLTKVFLWPLAVWLLATRRYRSVFIACVGCVVAIALSAIPLGFGVLVHYPALLRSVSRLEAPGSASLVGLGATLTGSTTVGFVMSFVGGALLLLLAVLSGRRGDDSHAFRLCVVASLALTPIVWNHYLVLLLVPLALVRPRFSPLWLGTAWVIGAVGNLMDGVPLAGSICAIWVIALLQSGAFSTVGARLQVEARVARVTWAQLAGSLSLWAALVWVLSALLGVVPAVAALRAPAGGESASGTASLRIHRTGAKICFGVVTTGVPFPAVVKILDADSNDALIARRMPTPQLNGCGRYASSKEPGDLAAAFSAGRVHLRLEVESTAGRTALSGAVVRPQDSGHSPHR